MRKKASIKKFFIIQVFLFLYFSCDQKQITDFAFTKEDIQKFKHLENKETININGKIRIEENGCGTPCAILIENNHIVFSGDLEEKQTDEGIQFKSLTKIIELKINKNEISQGILETRKQNSLEKSEFSKFESYLKNFEKTNFFKGQEKQVVAKYLPGGVKINLVFKDDINKDGLEDFLVLYSFPIDFDESLGVKEQIQLAVIQSKNNSYYLQYDGYVDSNFSIKIIDIQKVRFFKNQDQHFIRVIGRGKRWSGAYILVWLE